MAIYSYKCTHCGRQVEALVRGEEHEQYCTCGVPISDANIVTRMIKVLSVPSPAQWGCRRP
jgi:putative FmdB family regulatory protein